MNRTRLLNVLASAVFLLGIVATVAAVRATPAAFRRLERKAADLGELRTIERQRGALAARIESYERLASTTPRPVADIAERAGIAVRPSTRRSDSRPAAGGWKAVALTVTFEDIGLSLLPAFIREAGDAGLQPPWQVTECNITALDRGRGRVVLTMEALER